ncbi:hypothetical protein [uncultured Fibrobacter sp.]|uniref:tetratricopeptide repeat protein n=1 Tax=uncultured Fibrobacter sp. TaxID=261512 RepID=UPI0026399A30|nr:hypothetical protein [uncultured Fibrobacter sp.]
MKNVLKSKFLIVSALAVTLGVAGCNLFNPTENVDIANDDADALTYEGYLKFRDNEYTEAEKYFRMAIEADSNHSEAWYGLMKSTLNRKLNGEATNVFSLLTYVNSSRDSKVPFAGMPEDVAMNLKETIDTVNAIASIFIERDKAGKTDSVITYKTISEGYLVIQMMKTMLVMRKTTEKMDGCSLDKKSENACDMGAVLNSLKNNDPQESVEAFHEVFSTCEENPEGMSNMFDTYLQGFDNLTPEAQQKSVRSMCGALAQETAQTDDLDQQTKTLNIIIGQFGYSDIIDDDGDGCVDEEVYDGEDNDGDGEIDEDISDKTNEIIYDDNLILRNITAGKTEIRDIRVVKSAAPNRKYKDVDIDMNGKTVNSDSKEELSEWAFVYPDYNKRVSNGDHRFVFAKDLVFNPLGLSPEEYKAVKKAIAKDTDPNNIQYNLEVRKQNVGGCWVNYDEKSFAKWFEGRGM